MGPKRKNSGGHPKLHERERFLAVSPPASRSIALAILLIMASFVLVKTGRDALYVQQREIFD